MGPTGTCSTFRQDLRLNSLLNKLHLTLSQGVHGMWYAGSSVIFESVPAVMEYNELLLRQMEE